VKKLTETTQIKPKRIIKPLKKLSPRHIVAQELLEKSQIPITTIAKALNYNRCYVNELKKKLDKTSIVSEKAKRLAKKAVIETLEMKPIVLNSVDKSNNVIGIGDTIINPTISHRLQAASMVLDRSEPAVQRHESASVNLNLSAADWDGYAKFRRTE